MDELAQRIEYICAKELSRCVLSAPVKGETEYVKIGIRPLNGAYQAEMLTQTQAFHQRIEAEELAGYLAAQLSGPFRQLSAWDGAHEHSLRISKKGKLLYNRQASDLPQTAEGHNRKKRYLIEEGTPIEPLIDMGLLTKEGKVVASMGDKFRQINRFLEIVDDETKNLDPSKPFTVLDFGCGKSYLTFVLYYYFTQIRGLNARMIGLDLKADVIAKCSAAAKRYGYENLSFQVGDIAGYAPSGGVDMVVTLHACDTATDYALFSAIRWNARMIFSVPCCQHELNAQIKSEDYSLLTRYGIVKERVAALMTDAIRANLLECFGYRAQLLEFIDLDHTPKNILIRAVRANRTDRAKARAEVERLMAEFHLQPTLYGLLYPEA